MPAVYKLPGMEPIELLRTSVFKTTNNPDLTDAIIRIFDVAGDDTEIAMRSLGNLVGYEFAEFIMQLADIAFDREPALCIDPSYNDATVEIEARPKHPTGCFVQPIIAQGNPAKAMRDEQVTGKGNHQVQQHERFRETDVPDYQGNGPEVPYREA